MLFRTPVILKGESSTASLTYNCGNYSLTPLTSTKLTGTFKPTAVTGDSDYFLGKDDAVGFYHWNKNELPANRAYLTAANVAALVKGFVFDFDDDSTGIKDFFNALKDSEATIYNLAGQRISKMQKGVNIVNGKKVLK